MSADLDSSTAGCYSYKGPAWLCVGLSIWTGHGGGRRYNITSVIYVVNVLVFVGRRCLVGQTDCAVV